MDSKVFFNMSYGLYLLSALDGKRPVGCIVNSVFQITSQPATVALSVNRSNHTRDCIAQSGICTVSLLTEQVDPGLIGLFGFQSSRTVDKYAQIPYLTPCGDGVPVLPEAAGCCGWIHCKITQTIETATHTLFLAEVTDGAPMAGSPMTYSYYHKVVKGKAPAAAPTYQPEPESSAPEASAQPKAIWVCSICGYEYTGELPFEQLPQDWVCPICGQPKSVFAPKK